MNAVPPLARALNSFGLNDITGVVAESVSLIGDYRGDVGIVQLRTEGGHRSSRLAVHDDADVSTQVTGSNGATRNGWKLTG